ncbi:MAG TPA: CHAT domain-containing protein [Leptolyngbyaceae cyanobacterium M33_DOE_097]|uniref:CHAT domain-containing protein n=1 Tax=Oscillatoriales cyanobacterium SpSt-418 TaxID=2282169 RepID=A0A7C3KIG6_9CYAN|nr:CHAT domain-containing protein [Leptolyngbyaceae cyanobacterium M33_DOE_097]
MKRYLLAALLAIAATLSTSTQSFRVQAAFAQQTSAPTGEQLLEQAIQRYQAQQFEAAIPLLKQAQQAFQKEKNIQGESTATLTLGSLFLQVEQYRDAITVLEAYLPIARSLHNQVSEAQALGNLGIAYKNIGIYSRSIAVLRQSGKHFLELGDRPSLGQALLNLGNTFEALGDYKNAAIAYQQSLKIAQTTRNQRSAAITLNNLGQVYANQAKYQEATRLTQQSLEVSRAAQDATTEASALLNLGSIYHAQQQRSLAQQNYTAALKLAQKTANRRLEAQALGSLGLIEEDTRNYSKAIAYLQQSLAIARQINQPQLIGMTLNNLGHAFYSAKQLAKAEATLREAIHLLDRLRPDLSDKYNVSLFDTQIHSYNLLQQILIAANQPEAALIATEQGRARAFVELLSRRLKHTTSKSAPSPALTLKQIKQVAKDQNATIVEYSIVPDDDFKFRGKQKARESELFIWVVTPSGDIHFRRVDLKPLWQQNLNLTDVVRVARCFTPTGQCVTNASALRGIGVVEQPTSTKPQKLPFNVLGLRKLYELLITPIADVLPSDPSDRVIFIPQDTLFLVPFAALQAPNGRYLIDAHTLLTAPAIQVLDLARQHEKHNTSQSQALIVGNPIMPKVSLEPGSPPIALAPLPGSEQEAIAIADLLKTQALTGAAATKTKVMQMLPTANQIHLATHGLLEYSGVSLDGLGIPGAIALAPSQSDRDRSDSGLLTASEIIEMKLSANLVVLSACDTGQGRITGDGVIGLSRSFIAAGVPSVVVSLWSVPDAPTARLMVSFYQHLQNQPDYAKALRLAMLETKQDFPRPVDWAAFTLVGLAE